MCAERSRDGQTLKVQSHYEFFVSEHAAHVQHRPRTGKYHVVLDQNSPRWDDALPACCRRAPEPGGISMG